MWLICRTSPQNQISKVFARQPSCRDKEARVEREADVNRTIGVILIVLGVVGLAYGGFQYTTKEKVLDIGPIQATKEEKHTIPLPPVAGAIVLIGGVFLLVKREA